MKIQNIMKNKIKTYATMKRISEKVIFLDYFNIFLCENTKMFANIQTRFARKGSLTVKPFVFLFTHCDGIVEQIGSIKGAIYLVLWIRVKVRIDPTEPVFVKVYGAQESIPRNRLRQAT
jgi:hypothetical protein